MFCPQCGMDHLDVRKFCNRCGTNLDVVSRALTAAPASEGDLRRARRRLFAKGFLYFSIGPAFSLFCVILREILDAFGAQSTWVLERVALLGPFGMVLAVLWLIYHLIALGTQDPAAVLRSEVKSAVAAQAGGKLPVPEIPSRWTVPGTVTESTTYSLGGRMQGGSARDRGDAEVRPISSARTADD